MSSSTWLLVARFRSLRHNSLGRLPALLVVIRPARLTQLGTGGEALRKSSSQGEAELSCRRSRSENSLDINYLRPGMIEDMLDGSIAVYDFVTASLLGAVLHRIEPGCAYSPRVVYVMRP